MVIMQIFEQTSCIRKFIRSVLLSEKISENYKRDTILIG